MLYYDKVNKECKIRSAKYKLQKIISLLSVTKYHTHEFTICKVQV